MSLFRKMSLLTLTFLLVGPFLLFLENTLMEDLNVEVALAQILCVATAFWGFTLVEFYMTGRYRQTQPKSLPGLYIGFKGGRFLLSVFALVLYGMAHVDFIIVFSINLITFYLVTMAFNTIAFVLDEKKSIKKA